MLPEVQRSPDDSPAALTVINNSYSHRHLVERNPELTSCGIEGHGLDDLVKFTVKVTVHVIVMMTS
jgi:hypothetical protein